MTRQEFIQDLVSEITAGGSIQISLNEDEMSRIIDRELKYFYQNCREAVESKMAILNPQLFKTQEFKQSRTISVPCVWGVQELREIRDGWRLFGFNGPELSSDRIFLSDIYLNPMSSGMSDVVAERTIAYNYYDLMKTFTLVSIQFRFNMAAHTINILGHEPMSPVLIRCFVGVEESAMFDYYWFQRWCLGRCMIQIHRLLKTFEATAVGGVSITSYFTEYGNKLMDEVKEAIKDQNQADWFIMFP